METIKFYDPETKTTIEMPAAELAPGCVAAKIEGIEGTVYVATDKLVSNLGYSHPPFSEQHMELFKLFSETFEDVYRKTPEEWADGFRKDSHPEKEIEIWTSIGGAYNYFTKGKSMSPEHRMDYFRLVLMYFTNGPETVLGTVQLERLSQARAKAVIAKIKEGNR